MKTQLKIQPSEKSLEYLDFMIQYYLDNYKPSSTREIADHFRTSTSVVSYNIQRLVICGLVEREDRISRGAVPAYIKEIFEREKESINAPES